MGALLQIHVSEYVAGVGGDICNAAHQDKASINNDAFSILHGISTPAISTIFELLVDRWHATKLGRYTRAKVVPNS